MNLKILNKTISFTKASAFSKKVKSPLGSMYSVSTKYNEPKLTVTVEKLGKVGVTEHVLQVPLRKMPYAIEKIAIFPGPKPTTAVFPGPKPKRSRRRIAGHAITIGTKENPILVELGAAKGHWHIEPDLTGEVLNISLAAPKFKKPI